ncbi:1-phosphatidylinositol-4-phosphate 5-kinase [Teladorsagia circumcincta]|uniref:1-phosphatidylinositol-4-phosphate 5-kinase n=1 Tax=Teladorsagia circumcincta TaxID=45464 RepID=A0A2G9UQG3_TELCI|nr:1-phosphatidylinositol-4-phosphate 5-kinase [Teladorsagia circumcincta]
MLWARPSGIGTTSLETKEASFPQSMRKPPSLLCVNELYLQHENRPDAEVDNIRTSLQEEEDSGPDWFRNMDPDTLLPIKDDNKVRESEACTTENHFDPLPISVGIPCEKASENKSSSVKASLSLSPSKTHLDDDIERAFDLRAEHLLSYLCSRERLRDLRWKPIILKLAKEIARTVKVDVAKRRDNMNVVNYVHVKKLYVDFEEPQSELIWGVVCSKTVSHESMAQPLRDASVMIVAGSIEYERVQGRLSTLEPILNQEGEFLSKQILNECPPDRGCSVLLKGGDLRELKAVKRILLFLTSILYSSRLEIAFLNMFNIRMVYQTSSCDVCEARREAIEQNTEKSDFEQALAESVLSASPFIDYEPPYLESMKGRFCFNKSYECASSNCEVPMLDHSRKLVYGRVCVEVTTQIVVSGSDESSIANASPSQIFAWNYCDGCKLSSPVVPVNTSVWHLSFGKYLDYIAYTGFSKRCFRMASLADDIVRTAEDRLRIFTQHDHYGQYAGTFHTVLRQVVEKTIALIAEKREYAEELTSVDRVIIPSNDIYAVKANEALMRIREAIYQLITTWNDQSTVLAATVRAVKKNTEENGVVSEGGKSGSFFYRTQDDRFVVKQMSRFEIQSFVEFAPHYFEYVKTAVVENKLTALCKVYGVFRVGYKSKATQLKFDILVMEYLFYKHNVNQVWDLKGSLRNRMASTGKSTSDLVLLDENLMKDLWNKQLYIYPHAKAALNQAISNDSHFLSSQHVMDYSLLVGVDETNGELILGIVDYMRTYTLDKKLESWVKIVAIPGAHLPTILSPEMYCTRFSEAIDTYFPVVPDQWTGLGSAVSY